MKLKISPEKTLRQIQEEFHREFPFLRIEFFQKPHRTREASAKEDLLDSSLPVGKVSKARGEISITDTTKVKELEQKLQKDFHLYAQVFRKAGNIWLETSTTDDWTLEAQQAEGRESEKQYIHSMHNFADERD